MTTTTSATSSTSTAAAASQSAMSKLSGNFDTFLKLLTTQLQNQDPTKPLDTNEFTQQLVQYSQVEQQIQTNDQLKNLLSSAASSASAATVGFLGQNVSVNGSTASLSKGAAQWTYSLPSDANNVQLNIMNSSGQTVRVLSGDTGKGTHTVNWNGLDANGNKMSDGTYTLGISAKDSAGGAVSASTTATGKVDQITYDTSGTPQLIIGGKAYQTSSILAVQAQTAAAATTP
jgi:flagellar basal-body rod modification protein FlgD